MRAMSDSKLKLVKLSEKASINAGSKNKIEKVSQKKSILMSSLRIYK